MKFASIYLLNYIGIYNGMLLNEIFIDLTKCKHRMLIIRGSNGSGKSTLVNAMSLFPDSNDSFIPGLPARKEIVLVDGEVAYKLVFIHDVKPNGERNPTKAYITKTFGNKAIELNENGNVTSYKDILFSELGLDANFEALSKLSNNDRGLADKKPAERKKFVNSIISSLDVYNGIYKTLTKRSQNYKTMLASVVGKLQVLGDEKALTDNFNAINHRIDKLQDEKDQAIQSLAEGNSTMKLLDPDGSIRNENTTTVAELEKAQKAYDAIQAIITDLCTKHGINLATLDDDKRRVSETKSSLMVRNQIATTSIDGLIARKDAEANQLTEKTQRLMSLQGGSSYETLMDEIASYSAELEEIRQEIEKSVGIKDMSSMSKEEYILALETLKELYEQISVFKSEASYSIAEEIVGYYIKTGNIPAPKNIEEYRQAIQQLEESKASLISERDDIYTKNEIFGGEANIPIGCENESCPLRVQYFKFFNNSNPAKRLSDILTRLDRIEDDIAKAQEGIRVGQVFNETLNRFSIIIRSVDKNGAILSKMPHSSIFKDKMTFVRDLMNNDFSYMLKMYQYIDLANLFDTYRQQMKIYEEYKAELAQYESKAELLETINEDIERINTSISSIVSEIEPIRAEISDNQQRIMELQELENALSSVQSQLEKQKPYAETIEACRRKLLDISRKMNEINKAVAVMQAAKDQIQRKNYEMEPLIKERDKLSHSIQMMGDYMRERQELQEKYDYIEKIKYYSSPTTGIQLIFMELYMGKVIDLANQLLSLLFSGQFHIQPFIINDSEFRIPCLGNGYLNDDISSMSSSQIGMISMIISFSLLHNSSTKYNIIKLDEIDGPLDYNNRIFFMDVLNSIMDIMSTEQCIMISHNSELQVDDSDVIILRHDDNNDYNRGNIIWSY